MRILLCEDERELSNAIVAILKHHNYTVDAVYDGTDALDYAISGEYDVILLDIMMPKMNGLEVLRQLRKIHVYTPVLVLSAKSEIEDRITGLDMGADDYLPKPFSMAEMLARIRALTRRKNEVMENVLTFADLTLDRLTYELIVKDERIRLSNREFQMIEMLMSHPSVVISTENFMDRIWGFDSDAEINVVWVYISALRKKLNQLGAHVIIKAARGVGYTLEEKDG
ncbi:response regulator transcription factor [Traorella massiliensis]|uniref:response regulator transcription factor n=3 Tax=Traorella massiliensis TaxID=1903263 RepID=UPI0008F8707B|nr:response regulator transcription factor [Traorella massiliensis]